MGLQQETEKQTITRVERPETYFLKTPRLGFRHWAADDLPLAMALWGDEEVTRLIGGPFSADEVKRRFDGEIASMDSYGIEYWPIFLLAGDVHVGCCGLRPYRIEERIFELGFHLRRAFWGQGLAEEAARAAIGYAVEVLGARGFFAGHHPANAPSRRVLEKLGFHFIGEEFYPPTGLNHPSYMLEP